VGEGGIGFIWHRVVLIHSAWVGQAGPSIRASVAHAKDAALLEQYNEAVQLLTSFRQQHKGFAHAYIAQHSKKQKAGDDVGTGGSNFMPALRAYGQTTADHVMNSAV
jgi:hypothetical protein